MNARWTERRRLVLFVAIGLGLLAGCGRQSKSHYELGFADGEKLGKERRMLSSIYLPPEAHAWTESQRKEYWRGFRAGDAAELMARMQAQGISFKRPQHYLDGVRDGLKFGAENGVSEFESQPEEKWFPPQSSAWSAAEKSFYRNGFREAVLSPDTAKATLAPTK